VDAIESMRIANKAMRCVVVQAKRTQLPHKLNHVTRSITSIRFFPRLLNLFQRIFHISSRILQRRL
jgi:hypothetical protein